MTKSQFEVAKGHKDWFGADAILRNRIRNKLGNVFERYGYTPLETPIIEDEEVIAFKGGGEIQKEVYKLTDQGKRKLALRFDQTVPLARFVASCSNLKFPFKRYVMGPVFRDGPTQPEQGRYRGFWQCDVDVLGVKEMTAEAELLALAQDAFAELGLGEVEFKVNNRKLLEGILDAAHIPDIARLETIATLDKMDKIGEKGVRETLYRLSLSKGLSDNVFKPLFARYDEVGEKAIHEFKGEIEREVGTRGYQDIAKIFGERKSKTELVSEVDAYRQGDPLLTEEQADRLMEVACLGENNERTLEKLEQAVDSETGLEGIEEVKQLLHYAGGLGFDAVRLDPRLARGLDYYTGTTMEVFLKEKGIVDSAILAGGRFDNMVGDFRGGEDIPAVGFSFGLERLAMILDRKEKIRPTPTQLYIIPVSDSIEQALKIAHDLRNQGVNVDMMLEKWRIKRGFEYAEAQQIPWASVIGEDEISTGILRIKSPAAGQKQEHRIPLGDVRQFINEQTTTSL